MTVTIRSDTPLMNITRYQRDRAASSIRARPVYDRRRFSSNYRIQQSPDPECAPAGGQDLAAVLTGCRKCGSRSGNRFRLRRCSGSASGGSEPGSRSRTTIFGREDRRSYRTNGVVSWLRGGRLSHSSRVATRIRHRSEPVQGTWRGLAIESASPMLRRVRI